MAYLDSFIFELALAEVYQLRGGKRSLPQKCHWQVKNFELAEINENHYNDLRWKLLESRTLHSIDMGKFILQRCGKRTSCPISVYLPAASPSIVLHGIKVLQLLALLTELRQSDEQLNKTSFSRSGRLRVSLEGQTFT